MPSQIAPAASMKNASWFQQLTVPVEFEKRCTASLGSV